MGYRRRVELTTFRSGNARCTGDIPVGTYDAEIIGYTKPHARAPKGNAVERWRHYDFVAYAIHGGDKDRSADAMIFWFNEIRNDWCFMLMNRPLKNSYSLAVNLGHRHKEARRAFEAVQKILSDHVLATLLD